MSEDPDELGTTAETPVGEEPALVAGRYRIIRTLGKGGGGHVWLARDEKLGREIALKRVGGEADMEALRTRGLREARTSATLAHEHVVRVYDVFEHDGSPWIVMEHIPGPSLAMLLADGRRLPVQRVASIGAQLATALAAAHSVGILHRDVKPANVLLRDEHGQDAKLTDFGIARAEEDPALTRTGFVSGTAAYFSPELARGDDPSAADDVWALGATLYTALEGRRPFPDRPNAVAQLHTIAQERPRRPEHAGPLTAVLAGMLDPDPTTRWAAEHAARELAAVARGGSGPTSWPGGGAGAAAATAAAEQRERQRPGHGGAGDNPTQALPPAAATRALTPGPARQRVEASRPAGSTTYHRPRTRGRTRRTSMWLGWLLTVPLLVALGWLVWTIAQGASPGEGPGTTAEQTAAVGAGEAQELAEEFYSRLRDEGLPAARELTTEEAYIDPGITEGLTSLEVADLAATENPDGTATVTTRATYSYGSSPVVQDETLRVDRVEGSPRIVTRFVNLVTGPGEVDGRTDGPGG